MKLRVFVSPSRRGARLVGVLLALVAFCSFPDGLDAQPNLPISLYSGVMPTDDGLYSTYFVANSSGEICSAVFLGKQEEIQDASFTYDPEAKTSLIVVGSHQSEFDGTPLLLWSSELGRPVQIESDVSVIAEGKRDPKSVQRALIGWLPKFLRGNQVKKG